MLSGLSATYVGRVEKVSNNIKRIFLYYRVMLWIQVKKVKISI